MPDSLQTSGGVPWWRRVQRFCFALEPVRHARWETMLFRIAIAWVAWLTIGGPAQHQHEPQPHGMAAWGIDFGWLGNPELAHWLVPFFGVCLALYVLGIAIPLTLLPPLIASFGHGTLGNSQGAIGHTTQLVTVVLLAQWGASVFAFVRGRTGKTLPHDFTPAQLAADWTRQIMAGTYVASALTKLIQSHGLWFKNAPYFGLQIAKAMGMARYGEYGPGNDLDWLAQFLLDHPWVAQLAIGFGLPLELGAFLACCNRRSALFFGLALYFFHSTVTEVLHLGFVYHKALLLALFINPVWWLVQGAASFMDRGKQKTENAKPLAAGL